MRVKTTLIIIFLIFFNFFLISQSSKATIKTTKISSNLYQFFIYFNSNNSVNIFAFVGQDGVLLIDSGYDFSTDLVKKELKKIGHTRVKYIINTHNDGDHTGGNSSLGKNAIIICHDNCRKILSNSPNYPKESLPDITLRNSMILHFNNEKIMIKHLPGHTNNDIIVFFKKSNIAFLGDLIFSNTFPVIHGIGNLYSLQASLKNMDRLFSSNTRLLVSHGDEINLHDVQKYRDMIFKTTQLVTNEIKSGHNPDQIKESSILKAWNSWNSKLLVSITTSRWIDTIFNHSRAGQEHSAAKAINSILISRGIESAQKEFNLIKNSGKYYFLEADFNYLGYKHMAENKMKQCIFILTIACELYPESWNAFDSLGEAYTKTGQIKLAIKNYQKSVQLNPKHSAGKEIIKKLKSKI